jgi:hypothetical protein
MGKKKDEPNVFSLDDLPKKYLSAPVADVYHPELAEMYRQKKSRSDFVSYKPNSNNEKFFRLYFYQGVSQVDRVLLHQEFLSLQSRKYVCTGVVGAVCLGSYYFLAIFTKYQSFKFLKIASAGLSGYLSYELYKIYSINKLEGTIGHLYEKYAIR